VSPTAASPTAGQAGDDDVEETNDGTDDGLQNGANTVDDGHEAVADGTEDGFNLSDPSLATVFSDSGGGGRKTYA
jgi:hypothetical protein